MRWILFLVFGNLLLSSSGAQDSDEKKALTVLRGPFRQGAKMPDWNVGGKLLPSTQLHLIMVMRGPKREFPEDYVYFTFSI
jgi:hypothetical protein